MARFLTSKNRLGEPTDYEKKIAQLRSLISEAAKELQNISESKDLSLREVKALGERQAVLLKQNAQLEKEIDAAKIRLETTIDNKNRFIDRAKAELTRETESLKVVHKELTAKKKELAEAKAASVEVVDFIRNEKGANAKYLKTQELLVAAEKKLNIVTAANREQEEGMLKKRKELDEYYEYLKEMQGKMSSRLGFVHEATEYLNEKLRAGEAPFCLATPIEEVVTIPF